MKPFLLIALLIVGQPPASAKVQNGTIEGSVMRLGTAEGIADVAIVATLEQRGETKELHTRTDPSGRFSLKNVPRGTYRVTPRRQGYYATSGSGAQITLREGEHIRNVALSLVSGGKIHGFVLQPDGRSVSGVSVELVTLTYWRGQRFLLLSPQTTDTDARGEYRFEVAPGEYYVRTATDAAGLHARTYSPNTAEPGSATPIRVSQGSDISANIHLSQTPVFKIFGRIVDLLPDKGDHQVAAIFLTNRNTGVRDDALPVCGVMIRPCFASPPRSNVFVSLSKDEFAIRGVRPGSYDLFVTVIAGNWKPGEWREPATRDRPTVQSDGSNTVRIIMNPEPELLPIAYTGRTPVVVSERDVEGITVAIRHGVDVKGRLVTDGRPVSTNNVTVFLTQPDNSLTEIWSTPPWSAETDRSGRFTFRNVPEGTYALSFSGLPPDAYVVDIRQSGESIYDSGLAISRLPAAPLEVLVNPAGGVIEGRVENGNGARIVLVPATRRNNSSLYKFTRASLSGDFKLQGVAPGEYRIFAFNNTAIDQGDAFRSLDFIGRYEKHGVSLTVTPDGPVKLRLSLIEP